MGNKLASGDKIVIVEDVTTAGTSVYETMDMVKDLGVQVLGLVVSVDRMERGKTEKSAINELSSVFSFKGTAIVTMAEVVEHLYNKEYKGEVIINDTLKEAIDAYYEQYGAK